jgi:hypothetical protein
VILVVSHPADDHANGVLGALERAGHPARLLDTARFPGDAAITQMFADGSSGFHWTIDGAPLDLGTCGAAWWRRPQQYVLPEGLAPGAAAFSYSECHEAIAGLWAALPAIWVNPPELDERAHHKPFQLAEAARAGLSIPRTCVTNDPAEARRFIHRIGVDRTVYKTFLASEEHWRETRVLRKEELTLLDLVRVAPVIFQEFVPAAADVRVTVVGDRMFAAAITPRAGGYEIDYRMDMAGASFEATTLPAPTRTGIRSLMKRLGLRYGAVDLRRTPGGDHVFLEINPAGEWLFVEERTGQAITEGMARFLMRLDRAKRNGAGL